MRVYSNSDQGFYTEWRGYYFPGRHITFMVIFILCLQKNNSLYKHKTEPCNMALLQGAVSVDFQGLYQANKLSC